MNITIPTKKFFNCSQYISNRALATCQVDRTSVSFIRNVEHSLRLSEDKLSVNYTNANVISIFKHFFIAHSRLKKLKIVSALAVRLKVKSFVIVTKVLVL